MNCLLLSLGTFLNPYSGNALPDTLILKAGNDSKVIFYGKSGQDLKNLEKLDLNKILRELNQQHGGSGPTGKRHVVLDGGEFMKEPAETGKGQKYLDNTFLNLQIGVGGTGKRYVFFQPAPSVLNHPQASLTSSIVLQNVLTSSLSVMHDMNFTNKPKHAIALRYGAGIGFNIQRYLHWNEVQAVPSGDVHEISTRAHELLREEKVTPLQSDFNAFQSYLQLSPKLSLKNRKGLSTFYLGLGARLNYNRNFQNVPPGVYGSVLSINSTSGGKTKTEGPVITGGGYGVYGTKSNVGVSYLAEMGYKWFGVFLVYYPAYMPLTTKLLNGADRPESGFTQGQKGNIGYVSFGIKLGR